MHRYGLCIDDNLEPDGSSNNILELALGPRMVQLRARPRSYSFGGFCTALEAMRPAAPHSNDGPSAHSAADDGMEAFMADCDDEGADSMGAFLDGAKEEEDAEDAEEEEEEDEDEEQGSNPEQVAADRAALAALAGAICTARDAYKRKGATKADATSKRQ